MENNYEVLELEDGSNYVVIDKLILNNINYVYLINDKDDKDIMFQRIEYNNDVPKLSNIETGEEYVNVVKAFLQKNNIN